MLKTARAFAAAGLLAIAGPTLANITLPAGDLETNGDFNLSPFSYGTSGAAYVSALLFVGDLGSTLQPKAQVLGTALTYSYVVSPPALNSSVVDIVYSFTNTSPTVTFSNLRFMVDVEPTGSFISSTDVVTENWLAKLPGDPDKRQVDVFVLGSANPLKNKIQSANQVTDGPPTGACLVACDADFALEWDRATLGPSQSWEIRLRLVDDASLVSGGRYLLATSADDASTMLFVGNPQLVPEPETYAMLLAGLGLLAFLRMRRA